MAWRTGGASGEWPGRTWRERPGPAVDSAPGKLACGEAGLEEAGDNLPSQKTNNLTSWHGHRNSLHGHSLEHSQAACTLAGAGRRRWDLHVLTRLRARPQMRNP